MTDLIFRRCSNSVLAVPDLGFYLWKMAVLITLKIKFQKHIFSTWLRLSTICERLDNSFRTSRVGHLSFILSSKYRGEESLRFALAGL
mgnify:CR=1 FL=1